MSITRDQFNEANRVTKKIFQEGTHLLDSDLNEQADIFRIGARRILSCLTGEQDVCFGQGFNVVGAGASLAVTIKAGYGAFQIVSAQAGIGVQGSVLLHLAADQTLSGFTAWTGSRTDYIYIDITETEYGPGDDPNIINPDVGEETCRDLRLGFAFHISQGAAPGTAPSGHTYIVIATVTKTSGSNIEAGDATVLLVPHQLNLPDDVNIVHNLDVGNSAIIENQLTVGSTVHLSGNATIGHDLTVQGSLNASGQLNTGGALLTSGTLQIQGGLTFNATRVRTNIIATTQLAASDADSVVRIPYLGISSASNIVLSSTPTIKPGIFYEGLGFLPSWNQTLVVHNTGSFTITLQDRGTLSDSGLRLAATSITLSPGDTIVFMWDSYTGLWLQIGHTHLV